MRRSVLYVILALLFLLLSLPADSVGAQASATGVITGVVTDMQGKPIMGIDVSAWDFDTRSPVANVGTNEEGAVKTFVTGLDYPESIAFGPDGDLFVTVGYQAGDPGMAATIRTGIVRVTPDGTVSPFVDLPKVQYITVSPSGNLFATAFVYTNSPTGGEVYKIEPDGTVSLFATGFLTPTGLAFNVSGGLFVADDLNSSITRITGFPIGMLTGLVKDAATARTIQGATVSVISEASLVVGTAVVTDAGGSYSLRVTPGSYIVSVSAPGYKEQSRAGISVAVNEPKMVEFLLEPLPPAPTGETNWALVGGIIGGVVMAGLLILLLRTRRAT